MEPFSQRAEKAPKKHLKSPLSSRRNLTRTVSTTPTPPPRRNRYRVLTAILPVLCMVFLVWTLAQAQQPDLPKEGPTTTVATASPAASPSPSPSPSPPASVVDDTVAAHAEREKLWAPGWSLLVVLLLTLINGAFATAETALITLRTSRVDQLVEEGRRGALAIRLLQDRLPRFIATVHVGITLLGFTTSAIAAVTLAPFVTPLFLRVPGLSPGMAYAAAVGLVTILVALASMVIGGIAPKSMALEAPDRWALRLAPFIQLCAVLFAPLTAMVLGLSDLIIRPFGAKAQFDTPMITREEFEKMIDQSEKHGELDNDEAKIIGNVFDLSETMVRSVMTPRIDMTALPVEAPLSQTLQAILESGHSRIPVYENTIDNIVGVVHAKDLLPVFQAERHDVELRRVMRAPYFVPETRSVRDLLAEMRRSNQQIAIVQDEYAGTEGLVSIEDLLEEIVGEIRDEYDVDEPEVQVLSETESLIDGRMSIDDVNDRLGTDLPHEDYDTIGGLVFGLLGHEPLAGERVRQDGIEFMVERVEGRRIREIRAIKISGTEGENVLAEVGD